LATISVLEKKRLLFFDHALGFPIDDDATKAHFLDDNNIDDVEELKDDDKIIQLSLLNYFVTPFATYAFNVNSFNPSGITYVGFFQSSKTNLPRPPPPTFFSCHPGEMLRFPL